MRKEGLVWRTIPKIERDSLDISKTCGIPPEDGIRDL
jgi:hypothetical protein